MSPTRHSLLPVGLVGLIAAVVVLVAIELAGASSDDLYLDGHQVEGTWVSDVGQPVPSCKPYTGAASEASCWAERRGAEIATQLLLERLPEVSVVSTRVHAMPSQRRDGLLTVISIHDRRVVLTLADGTERVEVYGCAIGGSSTRPAFAEVCQVLTGDAPVPEAWLVEP